MLLTSIGFHTFTISLRLTIEEAQTLIDSFLMNRILYLEGKRNTRKRYEDEFINKLYSGSALYYTFHYIEKFKGLTWTIRLAGRSCKFIDGGVVEEERPCSIKATINPKVLAGIKDYIKAADVSHLSKVIDTFNAEAKKLSPILKEFDSYSLNRNDYCINFDLDELDINCDENQMMELIKQGNIPKHFKEAMLYDTNSRSHSKSPFKNSFYLVNNSVTINCYNKYHQFKNDFENVPHIEDSLRIVRFEVQCKYLKIYQLLKQMKDIIGFPNIMERVLSDDYSERIVNYYFDRIIRRGDYYTLDEAKKRIVFQKFSQNKEKRLIQALELVNQSRGIWKAKMKLQGDELDTFRRSLKDLDILRINPVTIPREWKIKHIPNLMTAYYSKIEEERNQNNLNKMNDQLLNEYIADCRKKKVSWL